MTPDERNARLTLNAAAESLRTAADLFCDWLEATRREAEEARKRIAELEEERNALGATADDAEHMVVEWATKCGAAERERDAARRELAALRDESVTASAERQSRGRLDASAVSDPAPLSCTGNPADSGNQAPATPEGAKGVDISIVETPLEYGTTVRPAPASAPRRWWIGTVENVLDGTVREVLTTPGGLVRLHEHERLSSVVVPVIEARVTRETVDRVAKAIREGDLDRSYLVPAYVYDRLARAALSALGLTVEDNGNG